MTESHAIIMMLVAGLTSFVISLLAARLTTAMIGSLAICMLNVGAWTVYGVAATWDSRLGMRQLIGAVLIATFIMIPANLIPAVLGLGAARVMRLAAAKLSKKVE